MEGDCWSNEALRDVNSLAASIALKEDFNGKVEQTVRLSLIYTTRRHNYLHDKDTAMKLTTIALASAFALSSTVAFAQTDHRSGVKAHHSTVGMVQVHPDYNMVRLHPNYGNPNGNPDGPTTLSGTGSSQYGGSEPGTSGYN
jgi:hypothetical protein